MLVTGLEEAAGSAGRVQLTSVRPAPVVRPRPFVRPDCGPQARHGGSVTHRLTTRPHLDHFRGQAKTLLAELRSGESTAVAQFRAHLPTALGMSAAEVRAAGFRLADAQSVIARQNGFASWPLLVRHVDHLRALEGVWHFEALQVDGNDMPAAMLGHSRLLMDGDRFRMESPDATYDGHFTIDASATPMQIDIAFVEGPEAGHHSYGLFELEGDRLTICLGLVGASRPTSFATRPGSGYALERLRRSSSTRPADVNGGIAPASRTTDMQPPQPPRRSADAPDSVTETSPMLDRLEGEWRPVRVVMGGKEMPAQWLQQGSRIGKG